MLLSILTYLLLSWKLHVRYINISLFCTLNWLGRWRIQHLINYVHTSLIIKINIFFITNRETHEAISIYYTFKTFPTIPCTYMFFGKPWHQSNCAGSHKKSRFKIKIVWNQEDGMFSLVPKAKSLLVGKVARHNVWWHSFSSIQPITDSLHYLPLEHCFTLIFHLSMPSREEHQDTSGTTMGVALWNSHLLSFGGRWYSAGFFLL